MRRLSKVLMMLLVCCTVLIFACGTSNNLSDVRAEDTVTRGEWIHTLVETFNMTVEDGQMPDAYYTDIVDSEYYDDIMLAVNFGVIDLEAGEEFQPNEAVTREFAAQTMNDCLCYMLDEETYTMSDYDALEYPQDAQIALNQGWFELVDGAFAPDAAITVAEQTTMLSHAEEVLAASVISEDYDNTYEFAEGIQEIPETTVVELLSDTEIMIYDTSLELMEGESFVVYSNGIAYPYKAITITEKDNGLLVVGDELDYEEAVTSYDAEGIVEADLGEFIPAEGVEMVVEYEETAAATYGSRIGGTKKVKDIVVSEKVGKGNISCTITDIKVKYRINSKGYHFSVKGHATTEYTISGSKSATINLGHINIAGIGKIQVDGILSADGSMTLSYSCNMNVGVEYKKGSGLRTIKSFTSPSWHFSAKAELKAACRVGFYISIPAVASGSIYGEIGVKANPSVEMYGDGNTPKMCMDLPAHIYALVKYSVKVFGKNVAGDTITIYNESNSPCRVCYHLEDGKWVDVCARQQSGSGESSSSSNVGKRKYYTSTTSSSSGSGTNTYSSTVWVAPSATETEPTFKFSLDENNNATITGYNGSAYCLTIPEEIDGCPVVAIGSNAFKNKTSLGKVIIPDGVTSIGSSAFYGCTKLESVAIPDSVTTIGSSAFYGCTSLVNVDLPNNPSFTTLSSSIFYNCSVLCNITIPNSVTIIGNNAFYNCTELDSINIPNSVTMINNCAFYNCSSAKHLKLSNSLIGLGYSVFYNCDSLESVTIPKSLDYADRELYSVFVTIFNPGPFGGCDNLKSISFEEGTTEISSYLFADCNGIEEIVVPDTITSIEVGSFISCANLKSVTFPDTLTYIGTNSFSGCTNLENINMPTSLTSLGGNAFSNCDKISKITIGRNLSRVGFMTDSQVYGPFNGCDGLKEVVFAEGISEIPSDLFRNCTGLEEIVLPDSIKLIDYDAFINCINLKQVHLPDSLNEIYSGAFQGCSSLQDIFIPDSVSYVGSSAFSNCSSLMNINIPNKVDRLNSSVFSGCVSLSEIDFPDDLKNIGSSCFYNCISLTKVKIPQNVYVINDSAFSHCETLTELILEEGITEIGSNAFEYCKALEKVTLPDSLQTLGSYAFRYCDALSEVNIGAGLKVIPSYCFYEDPALEKIVLPQQVTTVNSYAFGNCTKFADITMNRNVSTITANAFSYPDKLTIRGISGTYPETFATENEITFVALNTPATAIKLNATEKRLARGYTAQMTANITPADSSDQLTWTSSDEDIVTVDANGQIKGIATGTATIIAMAGDVMEFCEVTVYEKVTSVYIDQYSKDMTLGETYQLSATVYPTSASNKNITWTTSDETVATVDETGLVTAVAYGTATITVTTEDGGYTDTFTATVEPIAVTGVSLNAKSAIVGVNATYKLVATIAPENATVQDVTWTSSKPAVATVENGVVTGVSEGTAIIIVKTKDGAKTASCTVTVKDLSVTGVTLDVTELALDSKTSYQLTENILPAEATNKNVTWTSDNEKVATVENGKVSALRAGTATITVTTEDGGFSASCVVTVTGKDVTDVTLAKETLSIEVGNRAYVQPTVLPANADDTSVTWSSSDDSIVSIDAATGVITANAAGTATITVTTNDGGYEATCEVTVTEPEETETTVKVTGITIHPVEEDVQVGDAFTLTAEITPDNATNQDVIWLSSDVDVADINQDGEVTTYAVGEVTFTAIAADGGKSAEYTIEVLPLAVTSVELTDTILYMEIGEKYGLGYNIFPADASNQDVTWSSSDESVVSVSAAGRIRALRVGTATITITTEDGGYEDSCDVVVLPTMVEEITLSSTSVVLEVGSVQQLSAYVYPSDATDKTVAWSSSNPSVATVSSNGKVTAIAEGTANIIVEACDDSGVQSICVVTVTKKEETPQDPAPQDPAPQNPTPQQPSTQEPSTQAPTAADNLPSVGTKTTLSSGQYKVTKSNAVDKEVVFVKPKSSKKSSVSIPATVKINGYTYKVTEIGSKAFKNNKKLKSVTIGKNVIKIGKEAFSGCKKLKKITIKSAVLKSVGKNAIKNIDKKATIKVPKKQLSKYKRLFKSKTGYKKTMKIKK